MTNPPGGAPTADDGESADSGSGVGSMRIGDAERTSALDALAEHLTDGRITLDEYGERSARVTVARTVDELIELFDDLPSPHPVISVSGATAPVPTAPSALHHQASRGGDLAAADRRSRAQKFVAAAASASVFVALALFFLTGTWLWFLLIPAISGIAQAVWGPDWKQVSERGPRELGGGSRNR